MDFKHIAKVINEIITTCEQYRWCDDRCPYWDEEQCCCKIQSVTKANNSPEEW